MGAPGEERGLDPRELSAWRGLIETTALVRRRSDQVLTADSGLSGSDYPVLVTLHERGAEAIRMAELAEQIGWEQSRLSHHLARMEKRGLVSRRPCAADRRGFEVALTPEGRTTFLTAAPTHSAFVRTHFADVLSVAQLDALIDVMDTLARHLDDGAPPGAGRDHVGRTGPGEPG